MRPARQPAVATCPALWRTRLQNLVNADPGGIHFTVTREPDAVKETEPTIIPRDCSNASKPRDDAIQFDTPALERCAHFADRGMDLVGTHEPRGPVAEDGLDDGDVRTHLGEPSRNRPPDIV